MNEFYIIILLIQFTNTFLIIFAGAESFRFNFCGPVLNLFCCHEKVNLLGTDENREKNKIVFEMDVNFRQTRIEAIAQDEGDFLKEITTGVANINQTNMKVLLHSIQKIEDAGNYYEPLYSINDIEIPDVCDEAVEHPSKVATLIKVDKNHFPLKKVVGRVGNNAVKFLEFSETHQRIFQFLDRMNYKIVKSTEDLLNLNTNGLDLKLNGITKTTDFMTAYKQFKKEFQEKFNLYFSIEDGNHRTAIISKILDQECFSDKYYKPENASVLEVSPQARIFQLFTIEIEYHPTQFKKSWDAKFESCERRRSVELKFGNRFTDYFSSFAKAAKKHRLKLAQCDDDNFFCHSHSTESLTIKDAYIVNYETMIETMLTMTIFHGKRSTLEEQNALLEICRDRKKQFTPFYGVTLSTRNKKNETFLHVQNTSIEKEYLIVLELMRLFLGNLALLPKFNKFLKHQVIDEKFKISSKKHCDFDKVNLFKDLLLVVHKCTNALYIHLMDEQAELQKIPQSKEPGKRWDKIMYDTMCKKYPTRRWKTFMAVNILGDIINVWCKIGHDPEPYVKGIMTYGSVDFKRQFRDEYTTNNLRSSILIHILQEYENQYNSQLRYASGHTYNVFQIGVLKNMNKIYTNRKKSYDLTNYTTDKSRQVPGHYFRMNDKQIFLNNSQCLLPANFETFMCMYYPCLASTTFLDKMKFIKNILIDDNVIHCDKKGKKNVTTEWNLKKFLQLDMSKPDDKVEDYDEIDNKSTSSKRKTDTTNSNQAKKPKSNTTVVSSVSRTRQTDSPVKGKDTTGSKTKKSKISGNSENDKDSTRSNTKNNDATMTTVSNNNGNANKEKKTVEKNDASEKTKNTSSKQSRSSASCNKPPPKNIMAATSTVSTISNTMTGFWCNQLVLDTVGTSASFLESNLLHMYNMVNTDVNELTNQQIIKMHQDLKAEIEECRSKATDLCQRNKQWKEDTVPIEDLDENTTFVITKEDYDGYLAYKMNVLKMQDNTISSVKSRKTTKTTTSKTTLPIVEKNACGTFDDITCAECGKQTSHRCMKILTNGGMMCEGKQICGTPFCVTCKLKRDCSETKNRCRKHNEK